jgi:hypothetical protein
MASGCSSPFIVASNFQQACTIGRGIHIYLRVELGLRCDGPRSGVWGGEKRLRRALTENNKTWGKAERIPLRGRKRGQACVPGTLPSACNSIVQREIEFPKFICL